MGILELTLSGTAFVLAAAALRAAALRRLPKGTFVALWWAAALRLLIPVPLYSGFSVYGLLDALRTQAPEVPAVPAPVPAAPGRVFILPPAAGTPVPVEPAPAPFPVWTVLWVAVAAALGLWFLVRYVRWRRRFRESLPADCPDLETWFHLRRRVRVRVTGQIAAPLTYGLLRPVILLPATLDLGDEEAVSCVLAHELVHIRRLDGLLKLALTAALCVHWFNPAVWLLYVLGNRDMELRCDEAAVLALGTDSRERYALALLRLAEHQSVSLCGFSGKTGMEERIRAIMSVKKQSMLACVIALALVLGITTAFATSAKPQEADGPDREDIIDGELLAASSAESAALWDETLAPYEPFGLSWSFDDPDLDGNGLTMTWEGHEVRGIYDQERTLWITEHTGDSTFGPDSVELCTIYENGELAGLRLAAEEEQKLFDRDRRLSSDGLKVQALADSVRYDSGHIYFTIPESEGRWSIFIQGRILLEDGSGMSVHYLEEESEKAEWVPRMTYSFEAADAAYEELTMDVRYGAAGYFYPLTQLLPEGKPLAADPLPEGKADVPEDAFLVWPVDGGTVSQAQQTRTNPETGETETHSGVDIAVEKGTPVYTAGRGTVKEAGYNARDGHFVRVDHGNGQETFYAHCASLLVNTGDEVRSGQTIATVGSTGQSTGPHLHFEFLVNGVSTDPLELLESGQDTDRTEKRSVVREEDARLKEIERYYGEGSVPLFQIAFSRLDEEDRGNWLDRIYADKQIQFWGAAVDSLEEDCELIRNYAERTYADGGVAYFSILAARMSEGSLEEWLDKAREDENWAFQSVLFDALGRKDEFDELEDKREKEWEESRAAEYQAAGVVVDGKDYYYQGQLVDVFLDIRPNKSFYTLDMNPKGTVNIKIVRRDDGQIERVDNLTEAELEELLG